MVFPYKVKYNGVHYPAGVDVPIVDEKVENKEEIKTEVKPVVKATKKAKTKVEV